MISVLVMRISLCGVWWRIRSASIQPSQVDHRFIDLVVAMQPIPNGWLLIGSFWMAHVTAMSRNIHAYGIWADGLRSLNKKIIKLSSDWELQQVLKRGQKQWWCKARWCRWVCAGISCSEQTQSPPGKVGQNQKACARRIATTKTDIPEIACEHVDVWVLYGWVMSRLIVWPTQVFAPVEAAAVFASYPRP